MTISTGLDFWTEGNAQSLASYLNHLEDGLVDSRFLDGVMTALFYNQGTVANLASSRSASSALVQSPYIRSLESLTQANPLRAVIETGASMLVREADYKIQTAGSTWKVQRSARKLSQFVSGVGRKNKLTQTTHQVFLDWCTNRVGGAKVFVENNKIKIERVRPDTIRYANHEGPYSKTIGCDYGVPLSRVRALWPKDAGGNEIGQDTYNSFPKWTPNPFYLVDIISPYVDFGMVRVSEGWHCSSGEGDPGRHVVTCGDTVLVDEKWEFDFPGLIIGRWSGSYAGMSGTPLGEQLIPYQMQLQRMDRTITEAISKLAIGRVWLKKFGPGTGAPPTLTDKPADVSYYSGDQPPIIQPGVAMGAEYYNRRQLLRAEMFELAGVSLAQSSGAKEAGLTAGIALRENNEQAYSRLKLQAAGVDQWLEDIAYAVIGLADKHFSKTGYQVAAPGSRLLSMIDWKAIDITEMGEYEVQARTMRTLPNHPSARAEMLMEWVKLGRLDPKRIIKLMGSRDLEDIEDRASIAEELAERQISAAIDDGKYIAPEPYQGDALGILVEQGQIEYLKGVFGEAPQAHLELLRRLVENARKLWKGGGPMNEPAPPAPPPAPDAGGMPPGGAPLPADGLPPAEGGILPVAA